MKYRILSIPHTSAALILSVASIVFSAQAIAAVPIALTQISPTHPSTRIASTRPGFPGRRYGDSSRCGCYTPSLVGIMPETHLLQTSSAHPLIHFLLPLTDEPYSAKFSLQTADGFSLLANTFEIGSSDRSIHSFQIPPGIMNENENYRWHLELHGSEGAQFATAVSGWIRRNENSAQLNPLPNIDWVDIEADASENTKLLQQYQSAEMWGDAITLAARLRQRYPNDAAVAARWLELMMTLELFDFSVPVQEDTIEPFVLPQRI